MCQRASLAGPAEVFVGPRKLRRMAISVNANDKTIEAVLTGGFYRVPRFQRPYSWDPSNVEDFWDDVIDGGSDYFIGSMVIFTDGDAAGLVDGQQRLTTVTMMLAAIRNEFLRLGADDAATGIQTLVERKDSRGKQRFVLHTETSYPYLQAAIQSLPGTAQSVKAAKSEERDLETAFELIADWTRVTLTTPPMSRDWMSRSRRSVRSAPWKTYATSCTSTDGRIG